MPDKTFQLSKIKFYKEKLGLWADQNKECIGITYFSEKHSVFGKSTALNTLLTSQGQRNS